jgi:hypothetical protein
VRSEFDALYGSGTLAGTGASRIESLLAGGHPTVAALEPGGPSTCFNVPPPGGTEPPATRPRSVSPAGRALREERQPLRIAGAPSLWCYSPPWTIVGTTSQPYSYGMYVDRGMRGTTGSLQPAHSAK